MKKPIQSLAREGTHGVRSLLLLWLLALSPAWAATEFDFRPPAAPSDARAGVIMSDLAARLIPVYQDSDPERYLANLSALQMAVGDYAAADISRQTLRERRQKTDFGRRAGRSLIYDMYAHAKSLEAQNRLTFAEAFTGAYRESMRRLDDHDAYAVAQWLAAPPASYQAALQRAFDQQRANDSIGESEAVDLIWQYVAYEAFRAFGSLAVLLNAEDDHRRYTVEDEVLIQTPDGASISALVVRPNGLANPLPALLEFRIDESQGAAKDCAAHGYVGVIAYVRGRRKSTAGLVPFQHDGDDARAVIDWIAQQAWSDGRVGMYGEGYGGFIPWAAAKGPSPALKAIATSASLAPGVNFPMEGGIFKNSAYGWSLQMAAADIPGGDDAAQWRALDQKWYRSGRRYRDLGRMYGKHNPIFIRWLNHPSYDRFWQSLVPYREQFAHVNVPVLTMTGYFASSEPGDLYYFAQHRRYNPHADDTLIIGPYDDAMMQLGPAENLHGYQPDSAARVDLRELRFQWFDHVFKGSQVPALLAGSVNYEVMGANEWRHVASLDAMADASVRYYLEGTAGTNHRLTLHKKAHDKAHDAFVQQTVSFTDRSDAAWTPSTDFISRSLAPRHGAIFISEPLAKPTEFDGLFSGRLDFAINKMDMDLNVSLYELLPGGDHLRLFSPTLELRASYARDRSHRHMLKAGQRQELAFKSERLTGRQLQAGSRLVMVLGVGKRPDREINYGTGGDISEESIADGKIPLKIRWYGDSYIDIPIHRRQ